MLLDRLYIPVETLALMRDVENDGKTNRQNSTIELRAKFHVITACDV